MTRSETRRLVARALRATVYRRLELMGCDLHDEPVGEPAVDVEYGFASRDDLAALDAMRPGLAAVARERFAHGERCLVGRCDGAVVMARWVARDRARIDFLGLVVPLAADEAYGFDMLDLTPGPGVSVSPPRVAYGSEPPSPRRVCGR